MNKFCFISLILLIIGCENEKKIEWIGQFSDGLAPINMDGKFGFIENNGKIKIPCIYSFASEFADGFGRVQINGKYGFIDTAGLYLIEPKYNNVYIFENGYSTVNSSGLEAIINTNGEYLTEFEPYSCVYCDNDIIKIEKSDGITFFNIKTNTQIGELYKKAKKFKNGLAAVKIKNHWGFINTDGELVVSAIYDNAGDYSEGMIKVAKEYKIGFLNKKGETIIPFNLNYVDKTDFSYGFNSFSNGLCSYTDIIDGKLKKGYINKNGQIAIPAKYDDCYQFEKNGMAKVSIDKKWGIVDTSGIEIIKPNYRYIWYGDDNIFKVNKNDKFGFVNERDELVTDIIYDNVSTSHLGKAVVEKENNLEVIIFE